MSHKRSSSVVTAPEAFVPSFRSETFDPAYFPPVEMVPPIERRAQEEFTQVAANYPIMSTVPAPVPRLAVEETLPALQTASLVAESAERNLERQEKISDMETIARIQQDDETVRYDNQPAALMGMKVHDLCTDMTNVLWNRLKRYYPQLQPHQKEKISALIKKGRTRGRARHIHPLNFKTLEKVTFRAELYVNMNIKNAAKVQMTAAKRCIKYLTGRCKKTTAEKEAAYIARTGRGRHTSLNPRVRSAALRVTNPVALAVRASAQGAAATE